MARRRIASPERDPGPAPTAEAPPAADLAVAADVVSAAAEVFGARPRKQAIHFAIVHGQGGMLDATVLPMLCGETPKGEREVVVTSLEHPSVCPRCLRARPTDHGSEVRVVAVLVRA